MADRVKVGIIGVGQIGKQHLEKYRSLPVEVVALADTDEAEGQRVSQQFGIPRTFTGFRDLLRIEEIEAVDVCVHNNLHAPITIAALEARKHVFCEKPIAGSYADGKAMVDAAARTGRKLSIQLGTLFSKETKAARRLIAEGHLGKLYYAKAVFQYRRARSYVDGYGSIGYAKRELMGGGALVNFGVYHVGQVLYLLGNPGIETVTGTTHLEMPMYRERGGDGSYNLEELALGFVRLAGGITLTIEVACALHLGGTGRSLRPSCVFGSKGGVCLSPFSYHTTIADMEMDATFDIDLADWRWHECFPDVDAYDSPQVHWIAALQNRVSLVDTAGITLATAIESRVIPYILQDRVQSV